MVNRILKQPIFEGPNQTKQGTKIELSTYFKNQYQTNPINKEMKLFLFQNFRNQVQTFKLKNQNGTYLNF